jgi:hypothetical protein
MNQVSRTRTDDSVQFSLAELRTMETTRLEHEAAERARRDREAMQMRIEAERQRVEAERAADERRIAAEREHERAMLAERMRVEATERQAAVDAEARLQAQRLEIEARKVDAELASRQAMTRPRTGALTWVLAAGLLVAAVAMVWGYRATERRHASLEASLAALEQRAGTAEARMAALDQQLAEVAARPQLSVPETPAPEQPVTKVPTTPTGKKPPIKKPPVVKPPGDDKIHLSAECINSPNGCDE